MRDRESMGVAWKAEMNCLRRLRGSIVGGGRAGLASIEGGLWNGIAPGSTLLFTGVRTKTSRGRGRFPEWVGQRP